ncbi:hypothetical protein DLJ47_23525 [Micromonospora sp. S4605]|uniref:hypothetical protein n=1 Tax=Micromonospora sp. S4605 TaxID=1420897 RepID=UPI000D6F7B6A|nr:hypothetical protein [Micromonospora sp. S4605]PWU50660.1 hypothetical protein DLJ47_23525 [Micromonospora sp. S4605]
MARSTEHGTVQIRGRYVNLDGTPAQGSVTFTGNVAAVATASQSMVVPSTITANLDADGAFTVSLLATDDPDLRPNGWTYTVKENFTGGRTYDISVPISAKSTGVNLCEVAATAPSKRTVDSSGRLLSRRGLIAAAGAVGAGIAAAPVIGSAAAFAGPASPSGAAPAALDAEGTTSLTGDSAAQATGIIDNGHSETLTLRSSYDGGEDDGAAGHFDSTGRLNLESYQRAGIMSYGEVLRIYSRRADSKQMIAWYGPKTYDPVTRAPIGPNKPWFWMGAHYEANDHGSVHGHWSCEVPDSTGALQTRLEMPIWDPATGLFGMDKTVIKTNQADLCVRTTNGQELRLAAPAGQEKPITFSHDSNGGPAFRRWKIRATNDAETGSNAGTNFQLLRYNDSGTLVDAPLAVNRSTGQVSIGGASGTAAGLLIVRSGGAALTIKPTAAGGQAALVIGQEATTKSYQGQINGDAMARSVIYVDGKIEWGSGSAARDTNLYRSSAGVVKTDHSLHVTRNLRINTTSLGGGSGVIAIANATTVPSANPTGGGVLFVQNGALMYRGSSGTVTKIAPA